MNHQAQKIIETLKLTKHPEGGYFKENYRADMEFRSLKQIDPFMGVRNVSTAIYFLLHDLEFSAFHKINQDELWHFYKGSSIELHMISPEGEHTTNRIGSQIDKGESLQFCVPARYWFAAKIIEPNAYALVGCTVSPGFDFQDFHLAQRQELIDLFPQHKNLVLQFTRE